MARYIAHLLNVVEAELLGYAARALAHHNGKLMAASFGPVQFVGNQSTGSILVIDQGSGGYESYASLEEFREEYEL